MHPRTSRRNDYCSDQQSFHQLLKVVDENGSEWRAIVRKEHLGGTKKLKMLFKQRKSKIRKIVIISQLRCFLTFALKRLKRLKERSKRLKEKRLKERSLLRDRSSSDLQSRYTETRKAVTSAIKKSKEKSLEEFGCRLDSNYFSANKVFWQTIRRLRGKRSSVTYSIRDSAANILTDEKEILSRWREYFEDLLNPVKASTRDTHEVTHLRGRGSFQCSRSGNGN